MAVRYSCTTKPQPEVGRRHVCSWQHYQCVLEYRTAREADEQRRDVEVGAYGVDSPEWREYDHGRMINFKRWLTQWRPAWA